MLAFLQEASVTEAQEAAATFPTYPTYLFAGLIGALGVFLLTLVKDLVRWLWMRRRERDGLLLILHAELLYNKGILNSFYEDPRLALLQSETELLALTGWADTRVRLAQLLGRKRFAKLAPYYLELARLKRLAVIQDRLAEPEEAARQILASVRDWQGEAVHIADRSWQLLERIRTQKNLIKHRISSRRARK